MVVATKKPKIALGDLNGPEGNVFCIVTRCRLAATKAGWSNDQWRRYLNHITSLRCYDDIIHLIEQTFEIVPSLVLACDNGEFDSKLPHPSDSDSDWVMKHQARAHDVLRLEREFKERSREWLELVVPHPITFEQVYAQAWQRAGNSAESFNYPKIIRKLLSLVSVYN